jgi:hypothetical protein
MRKVDDQGGENVRPSVKIRRSPTLAFIFAFPSPHTGAALDWNCRPVEISYDSLWIHPSEVKMDVRPVHPGGMVR